MHEPLDARSASFDEQDQRTVGIHFVALDRMADRMANAAARQVEDDVGIPEQFGDELVDRGCRRG